MDVKINGFMKFSGPQAQAWNEVVKIAERSSLKILPSLNTSCDAN